MMKRLLLTLTIAAALTHGMINPTSVSAAELEIGSNAPALDIEHWLQDGNGFFKPVKKFEDDKVYVVEFWATWCGPCIMSMPHLAELQQQYRGQGVQIISVTNETVDEVKDLMGQEHPQTGDTFGDITSVYSLTADPDQSVYEDYMTASGANGIPTAFIVGKDGKIEWTGHPASMDEPLAKVVDGSWDREAYKKELELENQLQENMQKMAEIAGAGKIDEALEFVDERIKDAPKKSYEEHWVNIRHNLKLVGGLIDDETVGYFHDQLKSMAENDDLESMLRLGNMLYGVSQQQSKLGVLPGDVISAIEKQGADGVPKQLKPLHFNTIALLSEIEGDFKKAAEAQTKAIEASDPRNQRRMMPYLEELREKAGLTEPAEAEEAKDAEAKK